MAENETIPTREDIAALPRWAQVAFAARCARRVLPLFKYYWPMATAKHLQALDRTVIAIEVATATYDDARAATHAAHAARAAPRATAHAAPYEAAAHAAETAAHAAEAVVHATRAYAPATHDAASHAVDAAYDAAALHNAARVIRFDFTTLRDRAVKERWTNETPVPPTVFGPMWPFGVPKDWPQENGEDRLVATIAPPPNATTEQIANFQTRLYEALNKLAIANGGAGLKVDSQGRDVPVGAPVGTGGVIVTEPLDLTPEELLRLTLTPSGGSTPAGTLGLIHAIASQLARQTGTALPAEADRHRPETHEERSGKIIAAESLVVHAIDQSEAANPERVAERDRLLTDGNTAASAALNAAALDQLHALFAEMAAAGFSVNFELKPAAIIARSGR